MGLSIGGVASNVLGTVDRSIDAVGGMFKDAKIYPELASCAKNLSKWAEIYYGVDVSGPCNVVGAVLDFGSGITYVSYACNLTKGLKKIASSPKKIFTDYKTTKMYQKNVVNLCKAYKHGRSFAAALGKHRVYTVPLAFVSDYYDFTAQIAGLGAGCFELHMAWAEFSRANYVLNEELGNDVQQKGCEELKWECVKKCAKAVCSIVSAIFRLAAIYFGAALAGKVVTLSISTASNFIGINLHFNECYRDGETSKAVKKAKTYIDNLPTYDHPTLSA